MPPGTAGSLNAPLIRRAYWPESVPATEAKLQKRGITEDFKFSHSDNHGVGHKRRRIGVVRPDLTILRWIQFDAARRRSRSSYFFITGRGFTVAWALSLGNGLASMCVRAASHST
jgi:hypothetical protein